ncbi:MAG: sigma-70 family RNA polymerase sigma factor [Rhodanobacteraceae bacterium]
MDTTGPANDHAALRDVAKSEARLHLDTLLARLDEGESSRGAAYEQLRRRLILMLRMHVPAEAEDLADVALDRLARRIHDGMPVANPRLYALGIARKLVLEARARACKSQRAAEDPTLNAIADGNGEETVEAVTLAAVSACLSELDVGDRALLLAYYSADGRSRIRARQRQADELGISVNALRNRALRLRKALEECARKRLGTIDHAR